jgi:hypothetical protein
MNDPNLRRLLVCGGRAYDDREVMDTWLWLFRGAWGPFHLIVGYDPNDPKFQGADQLAYEWAKRHGVTGSCFPAQWDVHGDRAGPIRNHLMLTRGRPEIIAHAPGGRGTADMIRRAEAAKRHLIPIRSTPTRNPGAPT